MPEAPTRTKVPLAFAAAITGLVALGFALLALAYAVFPEEEVWFDLLRSVANLLLINGVLIAMFRFYLQRENLRELSEHIDEGLSRGVRLMRMCDEVGVAGVHASQERAEIFERVRSSAEGDSVTIFQNWLSATRYWVPVLRQALEQGAHVRVFILREGSPALEARQRDLAVGPEEYHTCVDDLRRLRDQSAAMKGSLEVLTFEGSAYFPLYIIGGAPFVGFYLPDGAHESPFIEATGTLADRLMRFAEITGASAEPL